LIIFVCSFIFSQSVALLSANLIDTARTKTSVFKMNPDEQTSCCDHLFENRKAGVSITAAAMSTKKSSGQSDLKKAVEIMIYLGLWYYISGWYNIYNKQALNTLKLPWFVATGQILH
jgi:hypothetical protein